MRKNLRRSVMAGLAAVSAGGVASTARATLLTGSVDTIYSDNFVGPATNVNAGSSDPNAIVGNAPTVVHGIDGGSATAVYLSTPLVTGTTGTPDTNWDYHNGNSATITSPTANIAASGTTLGEDAQTITNLALPLVPVVGKTYDFELTMNAPVATGAHGLEMAFLFNNGNGHLTAGQAISNNNPIGLILDRDATASSTTTNYFDIFEGINTGGDTQFAPSASALTGGTPGTTLTVDELFTPTTDGSTGTEVVYINGIQAASFSITGATGGITDIQFGDNRDAAGTFTSFSLTATASVPEPTTIGLAGLGAATLLRGRRRR